MPKSHQRSTNRGSWSPEALQRAMDAVKSGNKGVRQSARDFGIPYSTLKDRLKTNDASQATLGRHKPIFSNEQEKEIAEHCVYLAKMFYGLTPTDLRKIIFEYAECNGIPHRFNTTKKMAGKDWFGAFMKRNPQVSLRKPEATSLGRITGFNEESVKLFYQNLGNSLQKLQVGPHRIYNMDETGITTVQVPTRVISPKGVKQLGKAVSYERGKNITVCCSISASGSYIPPMFIYPRARMSNQLKRNGPVGSLYTCSQKGWITEELFIEWLHHFKLHTNCSPENPILLVLDNHTSHCSLSAYNFCRENGITMVSFPPHTSHRLQPLDLTVFGPLKKAYSNMCSTFMRQHPHQKITPYDVAEIFNAAFVKIASIEKAQKGFQISGIWPYNSNIFNHDDFLPAAVSEANIVVDNAPIADIETKPYDDDVVNANGNSKVIQKEKTINANSIEKKSVQNGKPENMDHSQIVNYGASTSNVTQAPVPKKIRFKQLFPLEQTRKNVNNMPRKCSRAGTSKILTATPEKSYLEEKELKKTSKNKVGGIKQDKIKAKKRKVPEAPLLVKKKSEKVKRKVKFDSSSSDEYAEPICDDRSSDGLEEDYFEEEICIICNEFGKSETWFQCGSCKKWAHQACTGQDGRKPYVCDFCT